MCTAVKCTWYFIFFLGIFQTCQSYDLILRIAVVYSLCLGQRFYVLLNWYKNHASESSVEFLFLLFSLNCLRKLGNCKLFFFAPTLSYHCRFPSSFLEQWNRLGNADQGTLWVGRDLPPRGNVWSKALLEACQRKMKTKLSRQSNCAISTEWHILYKLQQLGTMETRLEWE